MRSSEMGPRFDDEPDPEDAMPTPATRPHDARSRAVVACVASAVLALVLGACGEDEPLLRPAPTTAAPTAAATPSASPAPAPTPSVEPNPAGLQPLPADEIDASFVTIENFFKAYEYGLESGDPAPLRSVSGKNCHMCQLLDDNIVTFAEADAEVTGGKFAIQVATLLESTNPGHQAWRLTMTQTLTTITEHDGEKSELRSFDGDALVEVAVGDEFAVTAIDTTVDE
ncbi:DUF6318 family protein [Sanguibacter sp. HDW7]|uniref:DUF6318 family protein n=1 Tax=Sanguibacter sp. HDW7 TaxID=2714931 RepID=UPI00140D2C63|nr:DUF6318 family protein [Sanguibacter sp. HDW7]QIK83215.1 hypothetical protein G7063_05910 [Sanguibacter sp. HDW7]